MSKTVHIKDDFNGLLDYQNWLKGAFANISEKNRKGLSFFSEKTFKSLGNWFGPNVTYEELQKGVKEYMNPGLLDKIYQKVKDKVEAALPQELKARKLKFNALGFGMFSFDRAAMTLYRNKEYYSEKHDQKVELSELSQTKRGYALKADGSPVIERWEETREGKAKVRTHTKDVFAYFPEVKRERPAVEFFISCVAPSSIEGEDLLYAGISAVIMAEILTKASIKIKINVVIGTSESMSKNNLVSCIIPVKHYDEPLDKNLLALMCSDPRFMRYDAVKGILSVYDHFEKTIRDNFGFPLSAKELKDVLEGSGYTQKLESTYRYYFGGTFSEEAAIRDITTTIKDISEKLKS